MDALTTSLTALGALLAAAFSGLNLYLSGHREEARWRREALLEAYDEYLTLSRNRDHVADQIRASRGGGNSRTVGDLLQVEAKLHEEQLDVLSRRRLLSSQSVVSAAENLHLSDHQLIEAAQVVSVNGDGGLEYDRARAANSRCKARMIDAVRSSLGLPKDTTIDPRMR
jgi:hypothetical protein